MSAAVEDPPVELPQPDPRRTLAEATALRDRGWRPFPLDHPWLHECASAHVKTPCDGKRGKHPAGGWATMTANSPADGLLERWFREPRNIGIGCAGSELLVVDDDTFAYGTDSFEDWCAKQGYVLPGTYRVRTSRGWHYYFSDPEREFGNTTGGLPEHIDIRGARGGAKDAGGYVVAAGSRHASGDEYLAEDDHADVALVPEWLKHVLRMPRERTVTSEDGSTETRTTADGWTDAPRYGTREQLLAQYTRHLKAVRHQGNDFREELFLAALDGWRCVDLKILEERMFIRALEQAIARVWGAEPDERDEGIVFEEARTRATRSPWVLLDPPRADSAAGTSEDGASTAEQPAEPEPSSWAPIDIGPILRGEVVPATASVGIVRSDGVRLLYPGKEHAVIGEMEAGKSWLALQCVATELLDSGRVLYVHFEEDDPTDTVTRLLLLGVDAHLLGPGTFRFIAPTAAATWDVLDPHLEWKPGLVVLDGQNEAMALHGDGINDPDGAAAYRRRLVRPFTAGGAAVLSTDHVTKDSDKSSKGYALGSVHKGNGLTGTLILLENQDAFGKGRRGASRVYVTKDRPAQVRQHGRPTDVPRKFYMGILTVDATVKADEHVDLLFWAPSDDEGQTSPFALVTSWHDVLAEEAIVPEEVAQLKEKGAAIARDIYRVLAFTDDEEGASYGELKRALKEGSKPVVESTFLAAVKQLVDIEVCERKGRGRVALKIDYLSQKGSRMTPENA